MWIPTRNPARSLPAQHGLNYYGPTVITAEGAPVMRKVFRALSDLYSAGPERVRLRGSYTFCEDGTEGYETLVVSRGELVHALEPLARFASEIIAGKGRRFILHLGI